MKLRGIRGAITIEKNSEEEVKEAVIELIGAIIKANNINTEDIAFVNFSTTPDIDCVYPAKFARLHCDMEHVPLNCYQEMNVKNSLKMCIRVLLCVNTDKNQFEIKHQYLRGAMVLRPDII